MSSIQKIISLLVVDGNFNEDLAADISAKNYLNSCVEHGCFTPEFESVKRHYSRQGWIQPPKLVELMHPKLKLSQDYVMPYNLDAYQVERLLSVINGHNEYTWELFIEMEKLNPELKVLKVRDHFVMTDYIMGMTSAINMDDIYAFINEGGGILRSESFRIRCDFIDTKLKINTQWVLSENTLKKIEDYVR